MGSLNFGSTPIVNVKQFSYVFLAEWILAIIAVLFIIFFFDRFVGFTLSQIVGWFMWKKHRVYLNVSAIKFSILGGRVFFKNLVYIGENEAFSILHGSYTWRYWLKRERRNKLQYADDPNNLPVRHYVQLSGVEWFAYNQSSAYEFGDVNGSNSSKSSTGTTEKTGTAAAGSASVAPTSSSSTYTSKQEFSTFETSLFRCMPMNIDIRSLSMVFGNSSTSSLLVGYSENAKAEIDVAPAKVSCDRYRMEFKIKAQKPKFYFTANHDYNPELAKTSKSRIAHWYSLHQFFDNVKGQKQSKKLFRRRKHRRNEAMEDIFDMPPSEHSKISKLLDCDDLSLDYFYDVPDICVKENLPPPETGYTCTFTNANFTYGPWIERRRVEFFELFWPQVCKTYTPVHDTPGCTRNILSMAKYYKLEGKVTLRIPTREFSKTLASAPVHHNAREVDETTGDHQYGWLEIVAAGGSFISLNHDLLPRDHGFLFVALINLKRMQLRTSVNHAELLSADNFRFSIDQNTPLQWNALQKWDCSMDLSSPKIFILREHINLAMDLAEDFGSSGKAPYDLFIPATYDINLSITDLNLYVNVNPQNVIKDPTSLSENLFLLFKAPAVKSKIVMPLDQVEPVMNTIHATTETDYFAMDVCAPSWHTLDGFLDSSTVGCANNFRMTNELSYYSDVDYSRVEGHAVDIYANKFTLVAFGCVVDYLITLIDNYGGVDFRFQTPEEFIERVYQAPKYKTTRPEVDCDYRIRSVVENSCFVMPGYLYSAKDNLSLFTESWTADLRFTNYYMDLQTEFSPVTGFINKNLSPPQVLDLFVPSGLRVLKSESLVVRSHRMFGLPPSEPTYICKWNLDLGDVILNIPPEHLTLLPQIGRCFGNGFSDAENKPQFEIFKPNDVTFVALRIDSLNFQIPLEEAKFNVNTSAIIVTFNDLSNARYSDKIFVDIPSIRVFASTSDDQTLLNFSTSCRTTVFTVRMDHKKHYDEQQDHIMLHDSLFHRCAFFLDSSRRSDPIYDEINSESPHLVPAIPIPTMPPQLTRETLLLIDTGMGQVDYHGSSADSANTASEVSLYGSGFDFSGSSSELDSDTGSAIVKRYAKSNATAPTSSKFLSPNDWNMPPNRSKDVKSDPVFPINYTAATEKFETPESDAESLNVVSEWGAMDISLHLGILKSLQYLAEVFDKVNIEAILDEIQVMTVDNLKQPAVLKVVRNVFLNIPEVTLRVYESDTPDMSFDQFIFAELTGIRLFGDITSSHVLNKSVDTMKLRNAFERLVVGVRCDGSEATRIDLSHPEVVYAKTESDSSVEVRINTFDFTTKAEQVEELANMVKSLIAKVDVTFPDSIKNPKASLIYTLLTAGQAAGIEHDSYVLSRSPPVQGRNEIRGDVSWRVAVRLRHIFNNLPGPLVLKPVPSDAKAQVVKILEHWRSWERVAPLNQASIFDEFELADDQLIPKFMLSIESFSTILKHTDFMEDYFVLDEFEVRAGVKVPSKGWTKLSAVATSERARLGLSWDTLEIIDILDKIKFEDPPSYAQPAADPTNASTSNASVSESVFQAIISTSVRDWSIDLQTRSLIGEVQSKNVQLVTTVDVREGSNSLYASGVYGSSLSAIRVYRPESKLELVDYLMEGLSVGFTTDLIDLKGPLWMSVNVGVLNLALNATLEELFKSVQMVFENEVAAAKRMFATEEPEELFVDAPDMVSPVETATANEPPDLPPTVEKALKLLVNMNLRVTSFVFKVKMLNNFLFVFSGADFSLGCRMPEEDAMLFSIEWKTYILKTVTENKQILGSFHVEGTRILARAELDAPAFDVKYGVDRVTLETASVLSVLKFLQSPAVVESYKSACDAASAAVTSVQRSSPANKTEPPPSPTSAPAVSSLCLNMSLHIMQVRISLPVEEFSFQFVFDEISAERKEFKWTATSIDRSDSSFTYVNTRELSAQLIQGDQSVKVFSVQLLGSYKGEARMGSIYFTSDFCKVVLSPTTFCAMCVAAERVRSNVVQLLPQNESKVKEPSNVLNLFKDLRAAIALRKFSLTWLTEQHGDIAEGITTGFELLQINLVSLQCRMDLEGFVVTPMNTQWVSLKKNKYDNFAYLPHVEIIGVLLADEKFVNLTINGEKLHINIKPSMGQLIAAIMVSLTETESLMERNGLTGSQDSKGTSKTPLLPEEHGSLMDYSLVLNSAFDSATLRLWDDNADSIGGELLEPSLELTSPGVTIILEFLLRDEGRDAALISVRVSESSNQIHPKAVQELKALCKYITAVDDRRRTKSLSKSDDSQSFAAQSEAIARLLKNTDVTAKFSLDTQKLIVSCQPFSRITTTLSADSVDLVGTTPRSNGNISVALSGTIHKAHVMLQHAHSSERSAFGGIEDLKFAFTHQISKHFHANPIFGSVNICSPEFEVRAAQIKDIELFVDIWNPKREIVDITAPESLASDPNESVGMRYKKLLEQYPLSWGVNISVLNAVGLADLGSSLGKVKIVIDRFWLSLHRSGHFQQAVANIDELTVACVGRVGGQVKCAGLRKRVTIYWDTIKMVPLVQVVFGVGYLDLTLSVDGHTFMAIQGDNARACINNQLTRVSALVHKLIAAAEVEEISVAVTSLVAANLYDVTEPLNFLRAQSNIYQKSLLKEEDKYAKKTSQVLGVVLSRLVLQLSAQIDHLHVYVFPTNFDDTTALKVRSQHVKFTGSQDPSVHETLSSKLEIELQGLKVGLCTVKPGVESNKPFFNRLSAGSVTSVLFNFPSTLISMETTDYNSRKVEYIFNSVFGGNLQVGWNLGTVDFIRELYETHKRTSFSRATLRRRASMSKKEAPTRPVLKVEEMNEEDRPEYVALQQPVIEIPNLHDMGNATPPVEWMGFNRERLPGMTHWFVIRAMNKIAEDVERTYANLL